MKVESWFPGFPGAPSAREFRCRANEHVIDVHLLCFEQARFDVSAFSFTDILFPPEIANSVRKRQAEYFYGRLAARMALLAAGWPKLQVTTGRDRQPMWPVGVVGAITHSDRYAAASIAGANRLNGIGIDIESAIGEETVTVIEEEILSPSELAVLRQTGVLPYIMLLTLAFSAKESFYKALFPTVNRYFGFETICLSQIDTSHGRIRFYLRQTLAPAWPAGRAFFVDFALLSPSEVLTAFAW